MKIALCSLRIGDFQRQRVIHDVVSGIADPCLGEGDYVFPHPQAACRDGNPIVAVFRVDALSQQRVAAVDLRVEGVEGLRVFV